jgi:3',5'-cyclic AMP phosphodiesterase CpdA
MATLRFAHISDIHLPISRPPRIGEILNKRALGYLSWRTKRRYWHRPEVAEALIDDLKAQGATWVLLSGDLVNIALPAEFDDARAWLLRMFTGLTVAFAPGNHDAYVRASWTATIGKLSAMMAGVREGSPVARPPADFDDFPFVAAPAGLSDVAVVVANSSPPTAPGLASGALGAAQIERIESELGRLGRAGRFRILMLHHPVEEGVLPPRKSLRDSDALRAAIRRAGVELVLHGHAHLPHFGAVATPAGEAPVCGAGSGSHALAHGRYRLGRCNLFELERRGAGWELRLDVREYAPDGIASVGRRVYSLGAARPAAKAAE